MESQTKRSVVGACRLAPSGLHLGHVYGSFFPLPDVCTDGRPAFFVISDCYGGSRQTDAGQLSIFLRQLLALAGWYGDVIPVRESALRNELAPLLSILLDVSTLRAMEDVHPHRQRLRASWDGVVIGDFLFPVHQACYMIGLDASLAVLNDDNKRFVDYARRAARRANDRFGHSLKTDLKLHEQDPGRLPGSDGRRMTVSNGNYLAITASKREIQRFAERLVGKAAAGSAAPFQDCWTSDTELVYFRLLGATEKSLTGNDRIDYLVEAIERYVAEVKRRMEEIDERDALHALESGEEQAFTIARETLTAAGVV